MKYFLLLIFATTAMASSVPESTFTRLRSIYPDQSEAFIRERVSVALTAENKWTSFPPYFYELLKRSTDVTNNRLDSRRGFCAGDGHFENFGYLFSDRPKFSLNDLDDSTICSLDTDAMRLYIGHRLLAKFSTVTWMMNYERGLKGAVLNPPAALNDLKQASVNGARSLSKKMEKLLKGRKCDGEYVALTASEKNLLSAYSMVHGCSRIKIKGGSAGYKRFVIFQKDGSAFELKPLNRPAPLFDQVVSIDQRELMFKNSVRFFMGDEFTQDYFPVRLGNILYQRRPVLAGNQAVAYDDLTSLETEEILMFEAYTLGHYHSLSSSRGLQVASQDWEVMAETILTRWKSEFGE